jgi:hypothetical protein
MTTLYLTYNEYQTGGEALDPEERWTSYSDTYVNFSPQMLYLDQSSVPGYMKESFDVPFDVSVGDLVHLVIARYSDGDTFSHTCGKWAIMGASKDPQLASALMQRISDDLYDGTEEAAKDVGWYQGYAPWRGYFESLDGVEIHSMIVW